MINYDAAHKIVCPVCKTEQERPNFERAINLALHHHRIYGHGHNCEVTEKK